MPDMERFQYINRLLKRCETMKHRMDRVCFNGSRCFNCGKWFVINETETTINHTGDVDTIPCSNPKTE